MESVILAIEDLTSRRNSLIFSRRELITQEINNITFRVSSVGKTPEQTLSRELQNLRESGHLYFLSRGEYYFVNNKIEIAQLPSENNPDFNNIVEYCVKFNKLSFGNLDADQNFQIAKVRKGQDQIRKECINDYQKKCAFCNIEDDKLLIASHISRWADDIQGRGDLRNVICMCSFHDTLFEKGYFTVDTNFNVIKLYGGSDSIINGLIDCSPSLRTPLRFSPDIQYILKHHNRVGYQ
jgi:hypothetical protein